MKWIYFIKSRKIPSISCERGDILQARVGRVFMSVVLRYRNVRLTASIFRLNSFGSHTDDLSEMLLEIPQFNSSFEVQFQSQSRVICSRCRAERLEWSCHAEAGRCQKKRCWIWAGMGTFLWVKPVAPKGTFSTKYKINIFILCSWLSDELSATPHSWKQHAQIVLDCAWTPGASVGVGPLRNLNML